MYNKLSDESLLNLLLQRGSIQNCSVIRFTSHNYHIHNTTQALTHNNIPNEINTSQTIKHKTDIWREHLNSGITNKTHRHTLWKTVHEQHNNRPTQIQNSTIQQQNHYYT